MKTLNKSNSRGLALALFAVAMCVAMPAFAAGGITDGADKILQLLETGLTTLGVVVITLAIIFAGYQIAFAHKRFTDVAPIVIGAILIGSASTIAGLLLNGA